jgi:hypothetical protein
VLLGGFDGAALDGRGLLRLRHLNLLE